jgi:hypothetical protein
MLESNLVNYNINIVVALILVASSVWAADFERYSINFFYNNKARNVDQTHLFPDDKNEECLTNIIGWAHGHPRAIIRLWFDSMDATNESVTTTKEELVAREETLAGRFVMVDMRTLNGIKDNPLIFSFAFSYLRFDFARVFAAEEIIKSGEVFIFANLNLPVISEANLTNVNNRIMLDIFGLVMAEVSGCYENNFFIRADTNPNMTAAIKEWLIDATIARMEHFFNFCRRNQGALPFNISQEMVFQNYPLAFLKFFELEGMGAMTCKNFFEMEEYPLYGVGPKKFQMFKRPACDFSANPNYQTFVQGELQEKRGLKTRLSYVATMRIEAPSITGIYDFVTSENPNLSALLSCGQ